MSKIEPAVSYTWIAADGYSHGRGYTLEGAYSRIGARVATGFPATTVFYADRSGVLQSVTFFRSDTNGRVWAIYDFHTEA